jgi:hypothetical protein
VFDHLLKLPMLDTEMPTETEVDQIEIQLIALVNGMADRLRALIRRLPPPDDAA